MSDYGASAGAAAKEISHEKHCPADGGAAAGEQAIRAADALGHPAVNRPPGAIIGTAESARDGQSTRELRPRRRQNQVIDCIVAAVAHLQIGACIAIASIAIARISCTDPQRKQLSWKEQKRGWRASECCRAACTWRAASAPNNHSHQTFWHAASSAVMRPVTFHSSE